jgi:hypothetical protein
MTLYRFIKTSKKDKNRMQQKIFNFKHLFSLPYFKQGKRKKTTMFFFLFKIPSAKKKIMENGNLQYLFFLHHFYYKKRKTTTYIHFSFTNTNIMKQTRTT